MKKLFLIVAAMFAVVSFSACSDDDDNGSGSDLARPALPDPNDVCSCMDDLLFMDYCYAFFDINKDSKVSKAEAEAAKTIDFDNSDWENENNKKDIKSLKGIGYFVNLEELDCPYASLTEVDLSQNKKLTSIYFYQCEALERVTLPSTLTSISVEAFGGCTSLTNITIPNSVTLIEDSAFIGCTNLTSITIPNNVTSIEDQTFNYCDNLQSFKGKFASSDNRCLIMNDGTLVAFAPAGLTDYTIPDGVTKIGRCALNGCDNLTNITIPESVRSIGDYGLYCENLKEIYCKPSTPPSLGYYDVFPSSAKIYVPTKSVNAYKAANGWNKYTNPIVGYDF